MNRAPLRVGLARWLALPLAAPLLACSDGPYTGPCNPLHETVTLAQAQAHDEQFHNDSGVAGLTTVTADNCMEICEVVLSGVMSCTPTTDDAGAPAADCTYRPLCGTGRAPEGLASSAPPEGRTALGDYLARAAHLEAASVYAFAILAAELEAHRAPASLVRAARRAGDDEVRHARAMTQLAASRGARPAVPRVDAPRAPRELEALLAENRVEGCVRETFGAVLAHHQARAARDPALRAALARIARDELVHAELSRAVARWGEARLGRLARARVAEAGAHAVAGLFTEAAVDPPDALREAAGLPHAHEALAIVARMHADLWAA